MIHHQNHFMSKKTPFFIIKRTQGSEKKAGRFRKIGLPGKISAEVIFQKFDRTLFGYNFFGAVE